MNQATLLYHKKFCRSAGEVSGEVMTVRGTINKFGFLLLMVLGGAAFTWSKYYDQILVETAAQSVMTYLWVGIFGGLACALAISFKPNWSPYLAPAYGILEGST